MSVPIVHHVNRHVAGMGSGLIELCKDTVNESGLIDGNGMMFKLACNGNAEGKFCGSKVGDLPAGLKVCFESVGFCCRG